VSPRDDQGLLKLSLIQIYVHCAL